MSQKPVQLPPKDIRFSTFVAVEHESSPSNLFKTDSGYYN
jgi:hypothetical protein